MSDKIYQVLFICTQNSARSILAEALLNQMGGGRFAAHSAGSHPRGSVHPLTLATLQRLRLPTDGLHSKDWAPFAQPGAPRLDFVFTVCDKAAGEVCPVWPGQPMTAHWGVEDPVAAVGAPEALQRAFSQVFMLLHRRISLFASLPLEKLEGQALKRELDQIGKTALQPEA